jgi:hypothetical protein
VIALLQPGSTFRTSHVGLYLSADWDYFFFPYLIFPLA